MSTPRYKFIRNDIVLVCDTDDALVCAEIMRMRDRRGTQNSDWWGHPVFSTRMADGCTIVSVPVNVHNISLIHECGALPDRSDASTMERIAFFVPSKKVFTSNLPLKPFQVESGEWIVRGDLRRILAHPMGLGKTIIALAGLISNMDEYLPAIVMAPAHVKLGWGAEWEKWGGNPDEVAVLFGRTPKPKELIGKKIIVLNTHILKGWADALLQIKPRTMIIDEAHNFVNSNTKTYPIAERIAKVCGRRVLLLTATPLVNKLGDLWGLCNLISPDILGLKGRFNDTFMPEEKAKQKMFANRWSGGFKKSGWKEVHMARLPKAIMEKRLDQLGTILRKLIILRYAKKDVCDQLPDKIETKIRLDISRSTPAGKEFWKIEDQCALDIAEAKDDVLSSDKMLPAFGLARRNAAMAKLPDAIAWIDDFLEESDETEKLVVVGWSVEPLTKLHNHFKKQSILINGTVDAKKKHKLGDQFRDDPKKRLLFGNIKSIGTGVNQLVVASNMLFIELPLTAVELEQVKGRIDRLTTTSNTLSYYYMTIRDSLEETMIWKIIKRKMQVTKALGLD